MAIIIKDKTSRFTEYNSIVAAVDGATAIYYAGDSLIDAARRAAIYNAGGKVGNLTPVGTITYEAAGGIRVTSTGSTSIVSRALLPVGNAETTFTSVIACKPSAAAHTGMFSVAGLRIGVDLAGAYIYILNSSGTLLNAITFPTGFVPDDGFILSFSCVDGSITLRIHSADGTIIKSATVSRTVSASSTHYIGGADTASSLTPGGQDMTIYCYAFYDALALTDADASLIAAQLGGYANAIGGTIA